MIAGYEVENVPSDARGQIDIARLKEIVNGDVAAMMVTNPSTLGVFEQNIAEAAEILHEHGALLYMDGANMNALAGVARPGDFGVDVMHLNLHKTFSTPHGGGGPGAGPVMVKKILEPYLPIPVLAEKNGHLALETHRPKSIGRVRAFGGNFGVLVRALAYTLAYGPGIRQATEDAVLNANYIRKKLEDVYDLPFKLPSMHEVVFSDARQKKNGVNTMDIAKRLIDYGFHPYTTAFPLIVPGAMMIEPTESESKQECDLFVDAMRSIAEEAATTPELVKTAPHSTRVGRLDEVGAARKPVLRWKPKANSSQHLSRTGFSLSVFVQPIGTNRTSWKSCRITQPLQCTAEAVPQRHGMLQPRADRSVIRTAFSLMFHLPQLHGWSLSTRRLDSALSLTFRTGSAAARALRRERTRRRCTQLPGLPGETRCTVLFVPIDDQHVSEPDLLGRQQIRQRIHDDTSRWPASGAARHT